MEIHHAIQTDLEEIRTLAVRALYLPIPGFYWHQPSYITTAIENGHCHVIRRNGTLAAFLFVTPNETDDLEIEAIAVSEHCREQGLGRQLISFAVSLAMQQQRKKVVVSSFVDYGARRFYEKAGFHCTGQSGYNGHNYYTFEMGL